MADKWVIKVGKREGARDVYVKTQVDLHDKAGLPRGFLHSGFVATDNGFVYVSSREGISLKGTTLRMIWDGKQYEQSNDKSYKGQSLITIANNFAKKVVEGKIDERVESSEGAKKDSAPAVETKKSGSVKDG